MSENEKRDEDDDEEGQTDGEEGVPEPDHSGFDEQCRGIVQDTSKLASDEEEVCPDEPGSVEEGGDVDRAHEGGTHGGAEGLCGGEDDDSDQADDKKESEGDVEDGEVAFLREAHAPGGQRCAPEGEPVRVDEECKGQTCRGGHPRIAEGHEIGRCLH